MWFNPRVLRLPTLLILVIGLVSACDDPIEPNPFPTITVADVNSSKGPLLRSLDLELDGVAPVEVFYGPIDGGRVFRMRSDSARVHEVLLPRLLPDTTYRWVARAFDGGRASSSVIRGTFETGPLPADLQAMDINVEGEGTFPLLMFGHRVDGGFRGLVAMEPDGTIVWYTDVVGPGLAPTPIPGSHDLLIITGEGVDGVARISPSGELVQSLSRTRLPDEGLHHDLAPIDDHRVAMIVHDVQTVEETPVSGEAVWIWDMETDQVEKVWSAWDHFDWDVDRGARSNTSDWLHANAISVGPRNNLLMSFHFLNQVISIAADYQSVEWRLGGTNATVAVSDEDQFEGQHSAFELDNGNVLLFDNRFRERGEPPADYSRGLELDMDGDVARVVWEYIPDPLVWARIISGIYALENGHRVVTFSTPPSLFTVHEADENGERVWRLFGDNLTSTFRAVPWTSIAGEERVDDMP